VYGVCVTQTSSAHSGSSALQAAVVSFSFPPVSYAYAPWITSEFPISQRYATFSGWYTYAPVSGDSLAIWCFIIKSQNLIGIAGFGTKSTVSGYTQFNATIGYSGGGVPDSCFIEAAIVGTESNGDTVHVGSTFKLDDLSLSGLNAIGPEGTPPATFALQQNYPNPFNPSTMIQYDIPRQAHVSLVVYNMLGQTVATLVDQVQEPGQHQVRFEARNLPTGAYIYRLRAGGQILTKQLMVLK
jgi:hypothetical protein